jgi:hypothetical protein
MLRFPEFRERLIASVCTPLCFFLVACGGEGELPANTYSDASQKPDNHVTAQGYALSTAIWKARDIPVCCINPTPADAQGRAWVQQAIKHTWGKKFASRFHGLGTVSVGKSK